MKITDTDRLDFLIEFSAWVQNGGNVYIVRDWTNNIIGEDITARHAINNAIHEKRWEPKR